LLDEKRHPIRCYEQLGYISWIADLEDIKPYVNYQSFFGGRILYNKEWANGYGIKQLKPL
jgi:hypothetical protein